MKKTNAKKEKLKKNTNKGITLIALVITIIVLLILAGVSISMLTGENGVLTKATQSQEEAEIAQLKEQSELARQGVMSGDIAQGKTTNREDIINAIQKEVGGSVDGNLITTEDGKYEIMVKDDNTIEVVEKGQGYKDAEYSEPAPESDFRWTTLEDGTVRIFEYLGTEASLKIPDTIEGKDVTVIWNDKVTGGAVGPNGASITYYGGSISPNAKLKSVCIPDTVIKIGDSAFSGEGLENIKLSSNLKEIDRNAFKQCRIAKINLPNKITSIGDRAFMENNLTTITLPESLEKVGQYAFSNNKIEKLDIKDGVREIGSGAFANNQIASLDIPKSVTNLGGGAFTQNNLEKIIYDRTSTGDEDRTTINSYAGRNAGDIIIDNGVKKIEQSAFSYVGLVSIELPETIECIQRNGLTGESLEKLVVSSNINNESNYWMGIYFKQIKELEFKYNNIRNVVKQTFPSITATETIEKMIVPYSEDHSILEYYKELIEKKVIKGEIGNIIEKN